MIIKFKYGCFVNDTLYGWSKRELYRLPQKIGNRFYPLKKVGKYKELYYVGKTLKSKAQLESMTVVIDKEVSLIRDSDVPF